jgi:hypothetical protein
LSFLAIRITILSLDVEKIHELAKEDRIAFKKHTVLRMHQRGITADEVKMILSECELVENYPHDYPLPSGLFLGYTQNNRPIHAVVVLDEKSAMIWVITVYEPKLAEWREGFKERKARDEMPIM